MKYRHLELGVIHMQAGFKPGAGFLNHYLEKAEPGDSAPLTKETRPKVRGPKGSQGEAIRKERMEGDSRLQAKESLRPPEAGKEAWGAVICQSLQRKLNLP